MSKRAGHLVAIGALCAAALLPGTGSAHPGHAGAGGQAGIPKGFIASLASPLQAEAVDTLFAAPRAAQAQDPLPAGPCTEKAKSSMPIGEGHQHDDIASHAFRCRMEEVAFLSLKQQLGDRENVILGEIDVQKDLAAVSVTYPRAGVLFFDVSDPAKPKYLSRWDGTECDQLVIDINCGAFVDISEDGKTAYLSVQKLTSAADRAPRPERREPGRAGCGGHRRDEPRGAGARPDLPDRGRGRDPHRALAHDPRRSLDLEQAPCPRRVRDLEPERRRDRHRQGRARERQAVPAHRAPGSDHHLRRGDDRQQRGARHLHPERPDRQSHLPLRRRRLHHRLLRLRHHRPLSARARGGVGPDAGVRRGLVRPHDRRDLPRQQALRDHAGRAVPPEGRRARTAASPR